MAVTVIYPQDYKRQQLQSLSSSMQVAAATILKKQQEKQRQRDREIGVAMELIHQDPELANTLGQDLVKRYGDKRPDLEPFVAAYQQKGSIIAGNRGAFQGYAGQVDAAMKKVAEMERAVAEMPDVIATQYGPAPNEEKKQAMQQLEKMKSPGFIQTQLFQELPYSQQQRAYTYAKAQGIELPPPPLTDYEKMTPEARTGQMWHLMTPQAQEAFMRETGGAPRPGLIEEAEQKEQLKFFRWLDEQSIRFRDQSKLQNERMAEQAKRQEDAQAHAMAMQTRREEAAAGKKGKDWWKAVQQEDVKMVSDARKENELGEFSRLPRAERAEIPQQVPQTYFKQLADAIDKHASERGITDFDRELELKRAVDLYRKLVDENRKLPPEQKKTPRELFKLLLSGE